MGSGFRGGDNGDLRGVYASGPCAVDTDFCVVATDPHAGAVDADSCGVTAVRAIDLTVMGLRAITLGDVAGSNACSTAAVPFRLLPLPLANSATSCVLNCASSRVLAMSLHPVRFAILERRISPYPTRATLPPDSGDLSYSAW